MKLINWRCVDCGHEEEDIIEKKEEVWNEHTCPSCGGKMKLFNFKNNSQRVKIFD